MPHTLARALVAILLIFAVGGHWFTLQSLAWAGMFAKFSQSYSITEALVKTFNGKNPCKLCIAVEQGKKSEQTGDSVKVETKLELFLLNRNAIMVRPAIGSFQFGRSSSVLAIERFERPPTPPPRYV